MLIKVFYYIFKLFPKIMYAAGDASSKLYYEKLDKEYSGPYKSTGSVEMINEDEPEIDEEP